MLRLVTSDQAGKDFYRTQVSLGSGLWVSVSLTTYIHDFLKLETLKLSNEGWEVTKGVGKVVVQELHEILELVCW